MRWIQRILAVTDFSERAHCAVGRASMLSAALNCETLEIMAVEHSWLTHGPALNGLCAAAAGEGAPTAVAGQEPSVVASILKDRESPTYTVSTRFGLPVTEILSRAAALPADLTVVAADGGNTFADLLFGYSIDRIVRLSTRPLLIVKPRPVDPYKKVLVAVDFSAESMEAARLALEIAPDAHVTFVHAFRLPDEGQMREAGIQEETIQAYRMAASEKARRHLNEFINDLEPGRRLVSRAVHHGFPVPVICDYLQKMDADLLAMGKRGQSRPQDLMPISMTRRLLDDAPCDLLIAPIPANEDDWFERPAA
jgi:nucleotide-binding universal stress UspA family protein